jgi:hypothetical protein
MNLLSTSLLRLLPALLGLITCLSIGNAYAQQGPARLKSQSMLVTATVERSCTVSWARLGADRKDSELRLCERPLSKGALVQNLAGQEEVVVSYKLTVVDQQTRLDF